MLPLQMYCTVHFGTVKETITYLGTDELKKFISVVVISDLNKGKTEELVIRSVVRARMCEEIGTVIHCGFSTEEPFILDLFTLMDAFLDRKMKDNVRLIGISENIKNVLLGNVKIFNTILGIINSFEKENGEQKFLRPYPVL
jgi:c-di-GMP-related signal transduction protein